MTSTAGRPKIPGDDIALKLPDIQFTHMTKGAVLFGEISERSPSKAAWFRGLIEFTFAQSPPSCLMTSEEFANQWGDDWFTEVAKLPDHKITVRIEEHHRILLRQWECYLQSLNWTRKIFRHEAILVLIEAFGESYNRILKDRASTTSTGDRA